MADADGPLGRQAVSVPSKKLTEVIFQGPRHSGPPALRHVLDRAVRRPDSAGLEIRPAAEGEVPLVAAAQDRFVARVGNQKFPARVRETEGEAAAGLNAPGHLADQQILWSRERAVVVDRRHSGETEVA